ncbi:MAG: hypothetical protein GX764_05445 [Firmicutes bacterium]|nr:hypothetical protein [Bacillota bacterium]
MAIYALADLHLSFSMEKPMDIFGPEWTDHPQKIATRWQETVSEQDLVIIPGDISWAMRLEEAKKDLDWLATLPGVKLLLRGNHDYWWQSISRLRKALPQRIFALQNDFFPWGRWAICGTRGWICPGEKTFEDTRDLKIYRRELLRLELSLQSAVEEGYDTIIAALHYPPVNSKHQSSGFTELLKRYGVQFCIYGHLHAEGHAQVLTGCHEGIHYRLVAADAVGFRPQLIVF